MVSSAKLEPVHSTLDDHVFQCTWLHRYRIYVGLVGEDVLVVTVFLRSRARELGRYELWDALPFLALAWLPPKRCHCHPPAFDHVAYATSS